MTETKVEELLTKIMSSKISEKDLQELQAIYSNDKNFWNKISVVIDLRLRSKKAKISSKVDNLIYLYDSSGKVIGIVIIYNENEPLKINEIFKFIEIAKSSNVDAYLAIIDKYGDITYYNLSEVSLSKG
ncbi:hypothetical protein [Acidianus ambivalens]|uniref:tRNA intron endonuclease catalytic domain-containing protein n=1 Tax=Acidianus ambivalens TaxID=2283 RepID=A0A650CY24_ACIAM|nr:hypothetical protein [Acidianus ambivalens]MQL54793.1 hypothetical protein [Acidianus ambivalens]QGR22585.1 hypothetical protein D1866_11835 [Acidianus ambivalens]